MEAERTLIQATVVGVNDSNILYPCCIQCYAKMLHNLWHNVWHCVRCNISCDSSQLMWRYRLSLCVADSSASCHISLFGNTLAQHFGCPAADFQRFLSSMSFQGQLLQNQGEMIMCALEMALVSKSYLFGLKLPSSHKSTHQHQSQQHQGATNTAVCLADLLTRQASRDLHDGKASDFVAVQMIKTCVNSLSDHFTVLEVLKQLCLQNESIVSDSDVCSSQVIRSLTPNPLSLRKEDCSQEACTSQDVLHCAGSPHSKSNSAVSLSLQSGYSAIKSQSQESQYPAMFSCDSSMEREFALSCHSSVTPHGGKTTRLICRNKHRHSLTHASSVLQSARKFAKCSTSDLQDISSHVMNAGLTDCDTASCSQHFSHSVVHLAELGDMLDETLDPEAPVQIEKSSGKGSCVVKSPIKMTSEECDCLRQSALSCEILHCQTQLKTPSLLISTDDTFSTSLNDSSLLLAAIQEDPNCSVSNGVPGLASQLENSHAQRSCLTLLKPLEKSTLETSHEVSNFMLDCAHVSAAKLNTQYEVCKSDKPKVPSVDCTPLRGRVDVEHVAADLPVDMPDSEDLSLFLDVMAIERAAATTTASAADLSQVQRKSSASRNMCTKLQFVPNLPQTGEQCQLHVHMQTDSDNYSQTREPSTQCRSGIIVSDTTGKQGCVSVVNCVPFDIHAVVSGDNDPKDLCSPGLCKPTEKGTDLGTSKNVPPRTKSNRKSTVDSPLVCSQHFIDSSRLEDQLEIESKSVLLHGSCSEDSTMSPTMLDQAFSPWAAPSHNELAEGADNRHDIEMPDLKYLQEFLNKVSGESEPGRETVPARKGGTFPQFCGGTSENVHSLKVASPLPRFDSSLSNDSDLLDGSAELFSSQSSPDVQCAKEGTLVLVSESCSSISEPIPEFGENKTVFASLENRLQKSTNRLQNLPRKETDHHVQSTANVFCSSIHDEAKDCKKREKGTPEVFILHKRVCFSRRRSRVSSVHDIDFRLERYASPVMRELQQCTVSTPLRSCLQKTLQSSSSVKTDRNADGKKDSAKCDLVKHSPGLSIAPRKNSETLLCQSPCLYQACGSQDLFSPCPDHNFDSNTPIVHGNSDAETINVACLVKQESEKLRRHPTHKGFSLSTSTTQDLSAVHVQHRNLHPPKAAVLSQRHRSDRHCGTSVLELIDVNSVWKQTGDNSVQNNQLSSSLLFNNSDVLFDDDDDECENSF